MEGLEKYLKRRKEDSLCLRIPHELRTALEDIAEREQTSVSAIAIAFMEMGVDKYEEEKDKELKWAE